MIHLQGFPDDILLTLLDVRIQRSVFFTSTVTTINYWCTCLVVRWTAVLYCSIVLCWGF